MTHEQSNFLERVHHTLYKLIRGNVHENQYVGTVKMGESALERDVFHDADVNYNWMAYWKQHPDGRNSEGSYKLRYPRHDEYVDEGMQIHLTIFRSNVNDEWIDIYAHYEYDNVRHPIRHLREEHFSAIKGVNRAREFFFDRDTKLYDKKYLNHNS